ncbi:MAG: hypothetical protein KJO19_04040 [Woeseia sp.]|nr:hypothetical protein [Woeseia sp.]MBT8096180.1 hypothetical protein [Woeseia sp.]
MTMTLAEALRADNEQALDLDNESVSAGYDKAAEKLNNEAQDEDRGDLDVGAFKGPLKKALIRSLNIALDDILAQAWSGWAELRKYADPEQTPPDAINVVSVANHSITSTHAPSVGVFVHGVEVHSFNFEVAAQFDVEGINLEVQGGKITEIHVGRLNCGGSIMLGDRAILEKEIGTVEIPGSLRLAKPVAILWGNAQDKPH